MLDSGRYLYAGFMAQQCAEKALKAVIEEGQGRPPKIHDLTALSERAELPSELFRKVGDLDHYYIATRYPGDKARLEAVTDDKKAKELLETAGEVLEWAKKRLT